LRRYKKETPAQGKKGKGDERGKSCKGRESESQKYPKKKIGEGVVPAEKTRNYLEKTPRKWEEKNRKKRAEPLNVPKM